eukprot:4084640-Alexandrium_andersonii.AAC.1
MGSCALPGARVKAALRAARGPGRRARGQRLHSGHFPATLRDVASAEHAVHVPVWRRGARDRVTQIARSQEHWAHTHDSPVPIDYAHAALTELIRHMNTCNSMCK